MGNYVKYLIKAAAGRVTEDDPILAGTPCLPRGAITKRAVGSVFGVAGNLAAGELAAGTSHSIGGHRLPSIMALGVTRLRLLIFGMNSFTGRPNEVLFDIPLSEIADVLTSEGRAVGMKKAKIDIAFRDGSTLELDIAREHMRHAKSVTAALSDHRG
ncbi:MAG TPA: hypothetical protein VG014_05180 [Acidimicrobiales bacterium]|nr:hypothetical protein [Acidimicrobiales bacterium]